MIIFINHIPFIIRLIQPVLERISVLEQFYQEKLMCAIQRVCS